MRPGRTLIFFRAPCCSGMVVGDSDVLKNWPDPHQAVAPRSWQRGSRTWKHVQGEPRQVARKPLKTQCLLSRRRISIV